MLGSFKIFLELTALGAFVNRIKSPSDDVGLDENNKKI